MSAAMKGGSMPFNFSWVVEGLLAGMGFPQNAAHFQYLENQGIRYLVSLTERSPDPSSNAGLQMVRLPIVDFTPPSLEQVANFLEVVEQAQAEGTAMAVHCQMGRGRTGAMLGCYLIKHNNLTAEKAIREIRRLRPGSLETKEQEQLLHQFEQSMKSRDS